MSVTNLQELLIMNDYEKSLIEALINKGFKWIENIFSELYNQYHNWSFENICTEEQKFLKMFEKRGVELHLGFASSFNSISGAFDGKKIHMLVPNNFLKICIDKDLNRQALLIFEELYAHEDIHSQSKLGFPFERKTKLSYPFPTEDENAAYMSTKQEINAYAKQTAIQLESNNITAEDFLKLKNENKLEEKAKELASERNESLYNYFVAYNKGLITMNYLSRFLRKVYYFLAAPKIED